MSASNKPNTIEEKNIKNIIIFNVDNSVQRAFLLSLLNAGHKVIATYTNEKSRETLVFKSFSTGFSDKLELFKLTNKEDFSILAKALKLSGFKIDMLIYNPEVNCYGSVDVLHASNFSIISKKETDFLLNINDFFQPYVVENAQFVFISNPFIPKFLGFENNSAIFKQLDILFDLTFPKSKIRKMHFYHSALPHKFWKKTYNALPIEQINIQSQKEMNISDFYHSHFPEFEVEETILNRFLDMLDSHKFKNKKTKYYPFKHLALFYTLKVKFGLSSITHRINIKMKHLRKKKNKVTS